MLDHEARLERLLARHGDAMVVEPLTGRPTVIRRDQLLVADHDVPAVEEAVRRWHDSREDYGRVSRIRLRPGARVDVCDLAHGVAGPQGGRHRCHAAAPNHLVYGQPMWWAGPARPPRPATAPPAPTPSGAEGRPVTIAVLDTGLAPHPWYESTDWYHRHGPDDAEVLDADLDYTLDAQAGHGTFIAGVLLQRAPAARLRMRRVLGGDGVGDELEVIRALGRCAGADVVNLSLGCHTYDDRPSPVVARTMAALGRATAVVGCAGNAATDRPFWPAALKQVIAVAALNARGDDRAWFSNYGWWVDASAPGEDITSSFVRFNGSRPRVDGIDPDAFAGYASWSGTSFAAPVVAGAIAHLAGREDLPATTAADLILDVTREKTLPDLGVVIGDAR